MRKIINTFKYGSAQVKRVLALCLLSGAATVGLAVSALVFRQMLLFFGMVIGAFVTLFLVQTFQIHRGDIPEEADAFSGKKKAAAKADKAKKEKIKKEKIKKDKIKKDKTKKDRKKEEGEAVLSETESNDAVSDETASNEAVPGEIIRNNTPQENVVPDEIAPQEQPQEMSQASAPQEQEEPPAIEQATEEVLETYNRHKIKKTFRKFKIKRDHRMVMVDHCKKLDIFQTPAYIWVYDKEFHILLIEKEPRHLTIPLYSLREISYLKKQPANVDVDYAVFQGNSLMAQMFKPYLPDYTHSTVVDDLSSYKNLYGIGPDIYFTNRSAASLFDLLGADFRVDDKVTMSTRVNTFFKEAYKSNILLRDNVIDANGYADRISNTLDSMARSAISYAEFNDTLNLMIKNKLITQEFAMYYMGVRDKISR